MALVKCTECGREVSDKAAVCVGCGAPIVAAAAGQAAPTVVTADSWGGTYTATKSLMVKLAAKAVLQIGWRLDSADENSGMVAFTTGVTWGSWSGVSGSVYMEEVAPYKFKAVGSAKQNVRGGQLFAPNIGGEAQGKVQQVIDTMRSMAQRQ